MATLGCSEDGFHTFGETSLFLDLSQPRGSSRPKNAAFGRSLHREVFSGGPKPSLDELIRKYEEEAREAGAARDRSRERLKEHVDKVQQLLCPSWHNSDSETLLRDRIYVIYTVTSSVLGRL